MTYYSQFKKRNDISHNECMLKTSRLINTDKRIPMKIDFFFIHPHSLSINEALKNKKKKFAKTNTLFN